MLLEHFHDVLVSNFLAIPLLKTAMYVCGLKNTHSGKNSYAKALCMQDKERAGQQQPVPDPIDMEFDRFNGGTLSEEKEHVPPEPLGSPVDLDPELDMYVGYI